MSELRVGILGASGYTGAELVRLVTSHPKLSLTWVGGRESRGRLLSSVLPSVQGIPRVADLELTEFAPASAPELARQLDVVFSALPHGEGIQAVAALVRAGLQVVDLSADYRLGDPETYRAWYAPHLEPELLSQARYGLVEWHRDELPGARLIACPGCYATSAILALGPLLHAGLVETSGIIVDAKSGVSGGGRKPTPSFHLPEAAEGIRPYKIAGTHRHLPEIEQELGRIAATPLRIVFTPQLAPMTRGILTCAYATAKPGVDAARCHAAACERYTRGLVHVLPEATPPDTLWVRGCARAMVSYAVDTRTGIVIAMCALDNLAKGASAQALQALNVARGWPDELGLPLIAQFP